MNSEQLETLQSEHERIYGLIYDGMNQIDKRMEQFEEKMNCLILEQSRLAIELRKMAVTCNRELLKTLPSIANGDLKC